MPSPFPGMDPYLEAHWGDVHSRLVMYISDVLQPGLPKNLYSRVEERVYVETDLDRLASRYPDVRVVEHPSPQSVTLADDPEGGAATLMAAEPVLVSLPDNEITERFIEIRDAGSGQRVVTVVEVLSRANKEKGKGRAAYLEKVEELQAGGVALLEIDLLRAGEPTQPIASTLVSTGTETAYRSCVWRPWRPKLMEVYPMKLRERLSVVPVPLRETDADVPLDLQSLVTRAYENGNYSLTTDYSVPPDPPLRDEDAAWAKQLIDQI